VKLEQCPAPETQYRFFQHLAVKTILVAETSKAYSAHTKGHHSNLETHSRLAKEVFLRDFAVFENQVAGGRGSDAQFVLLLAQ